MTEQVTLLKPPHPIVEFIKYFTANRGALIGFIYIVFLILVSILAPLIAPHDPIQQYRDFVLIPPAWLDGGKATFLLGTDDLGRDILSRLIYGARVSMANGFLIVILSAIIGISLGLIAGYSGGAIDATIMRFVDIIIAIPSLLLAIAVVAVLGPSLINAAFAVALVSIPGYVRLTRAQVLVEKKKDYVEGSRLAGAGHFRLMFNSILPNCLPPLVVQATLGFSNAILDVAALGFLGIGAQPPTPEWGSMLSSAIQYIQTSWWIVTFPGVAILSTVIAFNLIGDGLRDSLDPKLRQ